MNTKKVLATFCASLMFYVGFAKPVKAEPITLGLILKYIVPVIVIGGFWLTLERDALAEYQFAKESNLKHFNTDEYPIDGHCISPAIADGKVNKAWVVGLDYQDYDYMIKSEFCRFGGMKIKGKYVIGAFENESQAKNFASVVAGKLRNSDKIHVGKKPVTFNLP